MLNPVAASVIATLVLALFTMPITNLHDTLFLRSIVAQQITDVTSPREPEDDRIIALPASNGTKPLSATNQTEPCISPCPPGQICIQMCKPIGQPETLTITPEPSPSGTAMNSGDEQEKPLSLSVSPDQTTNTGDGEEQQSPVPDDEETSSEDEGKGTTTTQEPTEGN
jgi:hypothetical protein